MTNITNTHNTKAMETPTRGCGHSTHAKEGLGAHSTRKRDHVGAGNGVGKGRDDRAGRGQIQKEGEYPRTEKS